LVTSVSAASYSEVALPQESIATAFGATLIRSLAPGLFTANLSGAGVAGAVAFRIAADGTQSYEPAAQFDTAQNSYVSRPIDLGPATDQVFLLLFGTGIRGRSALAAVNTQLGTVDVETLFAGPQGQFAGLDQINVRLPRSRAGSGEMDVRVSVDGKQANVVRVNVK
jgi:uncharacterized protein (TIGR03437 family)